MKNEKDMERRGDGVHGETLRLEYVKWIPPVGFEWFFPPTVYPRPWRLLCSSRSEIDLIVARDRRELLRGTAELAS
jgi:hypothetical protein